MSRISVSGTEKGKRERDKKILALYPKLVDKYRLKMEVYFAIASKVGCGYNTVITVLQNNGIIEPKRMKK